MTRSAKSFHLRAASRTFTLRTAGAFLAFSLVLGSMSGLACAGRAVAAEAVGYLADDAFFSGGLGHGIDLGRRNLTGKGGTHKGSEPGLYGGSRERSVCDERLLLDFLLKAGNGRKKAAWAKALDIAGNDKNVRRYVESLTEVVLANDTLVANHGYDKKKRKADRYDALLEAGTAVLVDVFGVPRVKCNCGNPLAVSDQSPGDIDVGDLDFEGKDKGNKKWKVQKDRVIRVEKPAANQKSLDVVDVKDPDERIEIDLPPEPELTDSDSDSDSDSDDKTKDPELDQVTVPKVRGLSEAEATQRLKDKDFAVQTRTIEDPGVEQGRAAGTDPAGDSTAPARSTITLLIAGGPTGGTDLVDVPSVVGLSQAEAEAAIRNAGLVPTVSLRPGPAEQVGEVIEQQPSGQATDGSTVTLVVGAESSGGELDGGAAGDTQGGTAGL